MSRPEVELARTIITQAQALRLQQYILRQDLQREHDRSRMLIEQLRALIAQLSAGGAPPAAAGPREPKVWKRTKLFYKHRWLVSANVVAALRRAGVDCNIVVPGMPTERGPQGRLPPEWEQASLGFVGNDTCGPDSSSDDTVH